MFNDYQFNDYAFNDYQWPGIVVSTAIPIDGIRTRSITIQAANGSGYLSAADGSGYLSAANGSGTLTHF